MPRANSLVYASVSFVWVVIGLRTRSISTCQALSNLSRSTTAVTAAAATAQSLRDQNMVKDQLGYLPRNYLAVSARNAEGTPIAIKTYPLQQNPESIAASSENEPVVLDINDRATWGTPFPTHYWLTCPDISRAIGDLERFGYTKLIADYLNSEHVEAEKRNQLLLCHQRCGKERWDTLLPSHRAFFEQYESKDSTIGRMTYFIRESGIAGLNYQDKLDIDGTMKEVGIKCLHTHYAHFCSTSPNRRDEGDARFEENPVGRITHDLLRKYFPSSLIL